ncbi:MAG: alpha/beta fold hydrolase [Acidimicrobiia bacterium]|nr:alpha/beta fold hydrolase [Acidimicrobiia bacterium]
MLPPVGLEGLEPSWSRLITATDADGVERTWHVLDNRVAEPTLTVLCVHGNPTWSYLWRGMLAGAPPDVRVIAVDHLDMGYSDRTGTLRRLQQRVDDLSAVSAALDVTGPVVTVAHDWGGPISLGWAAQHRPQLAGIVLMNTAVYQPEGSPAPRLIRLARSKPILDQLCVRTRGFIEGTLRLTKRRVSKSVRTAYHAPYHGASRRQAIGAFVADIPLEPDHPSQSVLEAIASELDDMADVPALLLWGSADPVFSDLYLHDLQRRLPRAVVHRFPNASHLLPEEVDVSAPVFEWIADRGGPSEPADRDRLQRPQLWHEIDRRRGDGELAVVEMDGTTPERSITFAELAADVSRVAAGLAAHGVAKGERVALLVPPGIDLTVCLYACWRLGAVVVIADAGLGARGLTQAMKSAAPSYLIGVRRALAAARSFGWPGKRISVDPLGSTQARFFGVEASLDDVRERGGAAATPEPPEDEDVAAVVFTSGATGPAKGVVYRHHQAQAARDAIAAMYDVERDDKLVAAFGPFALFGAGLGITSVMPDMDVTSPGTLEATALASAVAAVDATLVFASPAALKNLVATAGELTPSQRAALAGVRLVMSAGAPVPAQLLREVSRVIPNAELHTPYGMTEALAVADIGLVELDEVGEGEGVCVGHTVAGVEVAISPLDDFGNPAEQLTTEPEIVGEVCIRAPQTKERYDKLWMTQQASAQPEGWHRSGDVGRLDTEGRLWIEGRLIHIITAPTGVVTPVGIEHAAQSIPGVTQAAAVGVGPTGTQQVIVVAVLDDPGRRAGLADLDLADRIRDAVRCDVAAVLAVPALPVDRRHNSKIDRSRVSAWAESVLAGKRIGRI